MNPFATFTRVGWTIVAIGIVCLLVLGYCTVTAPSRGAAKKAEAGTTFATGRTAAAGDASAVRDRADDRTATIDNTVQDGTDEIRTAPDRASANAAALRSLCRLNPGADSRCRVLNAPARRVD